MYAPLSMEFFRQEYWPQFYLVGYEVVTALPLYIHIHIYKLIFGWIPIVFSTNCFSFSLLRCQSQSILIDKIFWLTGIRAMEFQFNILSILKYCWHAVFMTFQILTKLTHSPPNQCFFQDYLCRSFLFPPSTSTFLGSYIFSILAVGFFLFFNSFQGLFKNLYYYHQLL